MQPINPEPLNMAEVVTEIKEKKEEDDSSTYLDSFKKFITFIDDGRKIDVFQIQSNELGLLKKPATCALNKFVFKTLNIHIY